MTSLSEIQVLEEQLSNMIAAGEVVERPASVVKELVENAIDAHAKSIEVSIEEGGLKLIKVVDDGRGMSKEDCQSCFERHATSKIKRVRDLFQIATLGFRGEALPSIAAVSRIELNSCQIPGEAGTQMFLEGGYIQSVQMTARPRGTEINVRDLFFNTPARLKYLKSLQTEVGHISDYVNRLALSYPDISFTLNNDGRALIQTSGDGQLLHAISEIYGAAIAKQMEPVGASNLDFEIKGYVCNPQVTRANRTYISLLVNGRYVRHFNVTRAILQGYHTLLPIHRYPIVVLSITMDPSLMDVNVHPAKLEVRFSKELELIKFIEEEIKLVLGQQRLIPEPSRSFAAQDEVQTKLNVNQIYKPVQYGLEDNKEHTLSSSQIREASEHRKQWLEQRQEVETEVMSEEQVTHTNSVEQEKIPDLYPLSQLHGTYILAQSEKGLYIIDQHAAQERIWYEYFMKQLKQEQIEMQDLLVPLTIDLSMNEMQQIREKMHLFQQIGIELEEFGDKSFLIRSHPSWFVRGEEESTIHEMVDMIVGGKMKIDTVKLREEVAIMMSCKAAIKANHHLNHMELEGLLAQLKTTTSPYTCPHGRPITVHFSTYQIEKMFKRVM